MQAGQLEAAIRLGMATDPARRPATPGELVERLRSGWEAGLPTGVVTLCCSDIEAAAAAWDTDPGAMAQALVRHDELIADAVEANGGRLVKTLGDDGATVSVFDSATRAVEAVMAAQRALAAEPWPRGPAPRRPLGHPHRRGRAPRRGLRRAGDGDRGAGARAGGRRPDPPLHGHVRARGGPSRSGLLARRPRPAPADGRRARARLRGRRARDRGAATGDDLPVPRPARLPAGRRAVLLRPRARRRRHPRRAWPPAGSWPSSAPPGAGSPRSCAPASSPPSAAARCPGSRTPRWSRPAPTRRSTRTTTTRGCSSSTSSRSCSRRATTRRGAPCSSMRCCAGAVPSWSGCAPTSTGDSARIRASRTRWRASRCCSAR